MSKAEREIKYAGVSVTEWCVGGIESPIDVFCFNFVIFLWYFSWFREENEAFAQGEHMVKPHDYMSGQGSLADGDLVVQRTWCLESEDLEKQQNKLQEIHFHSHPFSSIHL